MLAAIALGGCGLVPAGPSATTVTIYSSLPLQGGRQTWARDMVWGEKLALGEAGGQVAGLHIGYASLDDADPATGRWNAVRTAANARVASQDKSTIAYIGDWDSGATALSLPLINGAGLVQVSPGASYQGLTAAGSGPDEPQRFLPLGRRNFGRLVPTDRQQAPALIRYMRELGVRRIVVLADQSHIGAASAGLVTARARQAGIGVVAPAGAGRGLAAAISDARAGGADALVVPGDAPASAGALLAALRGGRGRRLKLFVGYSAFSPESLPRLASAGNEVFLVTPALPVDRYGPAGRAFVSAFRSRFGTDPGPWAAYGYEAMKVVLSALRAAGPRAADHQAVINAMFALGEHDSVLGRYAIGPGGDGTLRRFVGERLRGGRLVFDRPLG
ncbi:MAG TPA: branched-chain amino acid ABC transporter substrate-binding protein [Solirubrobacteraceae bacterium]|jgi:branched-chain amino acid transport system substrate-binding protein|nr:branched-chain amino acid ABC transporter substrate-binding protein [Solirubrobacteraceae bacterium]